MYRRNELTGSYKTEALTEMNFRTDYKTIRSMNGLFKHENCSSNLFISFYNHYIKSFYITPHEPLDLLYPEELWKLHASLNFHVYNIPKILERGEENAFLVFIIKLYLQTKIYIGIAKFNGRYILLFHIIIRSLSPLFNLFLAL